MVRFRSADDGRGIPVGIHPEEGVPTVEVVFTRLHAGGKFDKKAGGAYQFSGGLHGVGVSVTNALSLRLEVTVTREGGVHHMAFAGGDVVEPLALICTAPKRASGTSVRVWPDAQYFDSGEIPPAQLERVLKAKAVLLPGVRVRLEIEDRDGLISRMKRSGFTRTDCPITSGRNCRITCSTACSGNSPSMRRPRTIPLPRARARSGWWPGRRKDRSCASPTST